MKMFTFACLDLSFFTLLRLIIDLKQSPEPIQNSEDCNGAQGRPGTKSIVSSAKAIDFIYVMRETLTRRQEKKTSKNHNSVFNIQIWCYIKYYINISNPIPRENLNCNSQIKNQIWVSIICTRIKKPQRPQAFSTSKNERPSISREVTYASQHHQSCRANVNKLIASDTLIKFTYIKYFSMNAERNIYACFITLTAIFFFSRLQVYATQFKTQKNRKSNRSKNIIN